jgi:hypothetical protein
MILTKLEDLSTPIEESWSKLDYKNIELKNKINIISRNKKLIHQFDEDIDETVLHALKYYDNLNIFVIFGKSKNDSYKYYLNHFKDDYILYGLKHSIHRKQHLHKILYQLIFLRTIMKTKEDLCDYCKTKYPSISQFDENFDISILLVCKRNLEKKYLCNDIIADDHFLFIPNTKEEKWNASSLFFCNNSLKFVEMQSFEHYIKRESDKSKKMFLKYRSWLLNNIDSKNHCQFMLFSSVILYLIGHRQMNDLDLYVHTVPPEIVEKLNGLHDSTVNGDAYSFLEFQIKGTEKWPAYWNTWLDIWARQSGAKYFEEILGNPKYHFYFLGVKIISLECDIVRRLMRNRPRAYADLIAFRKRYAYNIKIPAVPKISYTYEPTIGKTTEEIDAIIAKGGILDEKNKEIKISYETNMSKFLNTISYSLREAYRMNMSVEEILKDLNMESSSRSVSLAGPHSIKLSWDQMKPEKKSRSQILTNADLVKSSVLEERSTPRIEEDIPIKKNIQVMIKIKKKSSSKDKE